LHRMSNEANAACHNLPFTSANCVSGGLLTISQEPKDTDVALPGNDNFISYLVEETAHRVRNPLTVVKGFVQLYRDNPQDIPWDLILDEVSGIERTLQDLMIFSHNYRPKPERINLNQVVAELFPGTEVIARQQGVWVELYLDRSPVNVIADSERIATLVNQLILNSLHAMPEGGILTIRTVSSKKRSHSCKPCFGGHSNISQANGSPPQNPIGVGNANQDSQYDQSHPEPARLVMTKCGIVFSITFDSALV
jgi:hypothetical protein